MHTKLVVNIRENTVMKTFMKPKARAGNPETYQEGERLAKLFKTASSLDARCLKYKSGEEMVPGQPASSLCCSVCFLAPMVV